MTSEQLADFYATPLGGVAMQLLSDKVRDAWGPAKGLRLAGFGHAGPILQNFPLAERVIDMIPAAAGPLGKPGEVVVDDEAWPLREASIDRLLVIHGLEDAPDPRRLMREAWRVLTDDGRLIIIAANRHGFWTVFENSVMAAGRAYSRRQLVQLLEGSMFAPTAQASALYFPPIARLSRIALPWERMASRLEPLRMPLPNVAGALLVEARRSMAVPVQGSKVEVLRPLFGQGRRSAGLAAER
ncbi:MAG: methyltransferase domain-containing protein, partial [Pseudomonadota bacterium]